MNSKPRTCTSVTKAVDAMQVGIQSRESIAPCCLAWMLCPNISEIGMHMTEAWTWVLLQAMEQPPRKVTFFPVVDDGALVGLVTLHRLVEAGL